MATLQVKSLDEALYKALGARAAMDNRSISQEVTAILREYLASRRGEPHQASRALLELAGSWEDTRPAAKISNDIRKARRSGKRFAGGKDVFA